MFTSHNGLSHHRLSRANLWSPDMEASTTHTSKPMNNSVGYCHLPYLARGQGKPQDTPLHLMWPDTPSKLVAAKHISLVSAGNSPVAIECKSGQIWCLSRTSHPSNLQQGYTETQNLSFVSSSMQASPIWYQQFKTSSFLQITHVSSGCRFDSEKLWVGICRGDAVCLCHFCMET